MRPRRQSYPPRLTPCSHEPFFTLTSIFFIPCLYVPIRPGMTSAFMTSASLSTPAAEGSIAPRLLEPFLFTDGRCGGVGLGGG